MMNIQLSTSQEWRILFVCIFAVVVSLVVSDNDLNFTEVKTILCANMNDANNDDWQCDAENVASAVYCSWSGIECFNSTVTSVSIQPSSQSGIEELGKLGSLVSLDVDSNPVWLTMPSSWCSLVMLQSLILNNFEGTIPECIGNFGSLEVMKLGYDNDLNSFTGTIPSSIGFLGSLKYLNLGDNLLTGTIPESLVECTNLVSVLLDGNALTGFIPFPLSNLTYLSRLSVAENALTGTIPSGIGEKNFSALTYLSIFLNHFTGTIPNGIGHCTHLRVLYLFSNYLSGSIPTLRSPNLKYVYLEANYLSGSLPVLNSSDSLYYLGMGYNMLTGSIPANYTKHLTGLQILSMRNNSLTGVLPTSLLSFYHVQSDGSYTGYLNVMYNSLSCYESVVWRNLTSDVFVHDADLHECPPTMSPSAMPSFMPSNVSIEATAAAESNNHSSTTLIIIISVSSVVGAVVLMVGWIAVWGKSYTKVSAYEAA